MIMTELPVTEDELFVHLHQRQYWLKMREARLSLLAEADAFGKKRNADTTDIIVYYAYIIANLCEKFPEND